MTIKNHPIAVCFSCRKYFTSKYVERINQQCDAVYKGLRCQGLIKSATADDDWQLCSSCNGSGYSEDEKCGTCQGFGWVYIRSNL